MTVVEPARALDVLEDTDVCVLGGSATGVFAAVRAARLGAQVALVEQANCFGGNATLSMVNDWHKIHDIRGREQIIGGLTTEVLGRLDRHGAVKFNVNERTHARYNTEVMKLVLDDLVAEHDAITPFLHTQFCAPILNDNEITAVAIENKSGRFAIRAKVFVDATGDGDLAARAGVPFRMPSPAMPGTTCAKFDGMPPRTVFDLSTAIDEHRDEFGIREDYGWYGAIPGSEHVSLHFDLHVFDFDATDARSLTEAEMRGRRQVARVLELIRTYGPSDSRVSVVDLPARIGIRESRHFECLHHLTGDELLEGASFDDAIGLGTYPTDVHDPVNGSTHLKFLDGTQIRSSIARGREISRWRAIDVVSPAYYQIPYASMVPYEIVNLLIAGRSIDADPAAHGAIRVMVNCNQTGEAAGVAAALSVQEQTPTGLIDSSLIREALVAGGSAQALGRLGSSRAQ